MKKILIVVVFALLVSTNLSASNECSLFMMDRIDLGLVQSLTKSLKSIEDSENCEYATLYILSPGGSVMPTISLVATMANLEKEVNTFCLGYCGSAASLILAAGTGTRSIYSTGTVMIHQITHQFPARTTDELEEEMEWKREVTSLWSKMMAHYTNLGKEEYNEIVRDHFMFNMSAEEALRYGFVDKIIPGML